MTNKEFLEKAKEKNSENTMEIIESVIGEKLTLKVLNKGSNWGNFVQIEYTNVEGNESTLAISEDGTIETISLENVRTIY